MESFGIVIRVGKDKSVKCPDLGEEFIAETLRMVVIGITHGTGECSTKVTFTQAC